MAKTHLLRVRDLRTNFYTYQGVVKALDGIDLDMDQGETLGLVGETGCGKSVSALSFLRLIPSPPGKIEGGEALFDVGDADFRRIESLRSEMPAILRFLFGDKERRATSPITADLLTEVAAAVEAAPSLDAAKKSDILAKLTELRDLLKRYDLLSKDTNKLREIRGHKISMIFQEPMQALNPVYTVGDQISESIILHRRRWLARRIMLRMREEAIRKHVVPALGKAVSDPSKLPAGVDLKNPTRADLRYILQLLETSPAKDPGLVRQIQELVDLEGIVGAERSAHSIFARTLPKAFQFRLYERECLRSGWNANDVLEELEMAFSLRATATGGAAPWQEARVAADDRLTLLPPAGTTSASLVQEISSVLAKEGDARFSWSILGQILEPPKAEDGHVVLTVKPEFLAAKRGLDESLLSRVPLLKKRVLYPIRRQALDDSADVLRLLKISDPPRVANSYPHELSGGMQQRALIAIALSCDPLLLIADEPTTALDVTIQAQILELLKSLKEQGRPSILIITHDLGVIADICDRVCVMYGGVVVEDAPVREVFKDPKHPYTRGLLKAIPSHAEKKESLEVIKGSVPNLTYPPGGCRFHPRCPEAMASCGWDAKDLEAAVRKYVDTLDLPAESVLAYDSPDPRELHVAFAETGAGKQSLAHILEAIEKDRPTSVVLQAVTETRYEGAELVLRVRPFRKPKAQPVSPNHKVACLLYEAAEEDA